MRSRIGRPVASGGIAVLAVGGVLAASAAAGPALPLHATVSVSKTGSGGGTVSSSPDGISCGGACSFLFPSTDNDNYQPVSLSASADPGSTFAGWGGVCSGTGGCTIDPILMNQSYGVTASFDRVRPSQFPLAVSVNGSGRVTTSPAGITCRPTCSASFETDSRVTLTATATPGWTFAGWSGDCSGTGECSVTMADPRSVTATFAPPETAYALVVSSAGGAVVSDIENIDCPTAVCSASYGSGVTVTLTAQSPGVAWGGACSGDAATCVVTMDGPKSVTASFVGTPLTAAPLAVGVVGKGSVSSDPGGIACGSTCGALYPLSSAVTLGVTPAEGWIFAGWRDACSGVAQTCRVTLSGPRVAVAVFVEAGTQFAVAVTKVGSGLVRSRPAGISCGATCSSSFLAGSTLTLEATAPEEWKFVRWSGACAHTRPVCSLGMDAPKSVSVTFARQADRKAPVVRALPSSGAPGARTQLRYRLQEQSGRSREAAFVFRGTKRVATVRGRMHAVEPDVLFYFLRWRVPVATDTTRPLRFCVEAVDPTGNRSRRSCAALRIG
jgi:uncharacterized repeat protein (TIGR02543 family)